MTGTHPLGNALNTVSPHGKELMLEWQVTVVSGQEISTKIVKLDLSFLALTTTGVLYTPEAILTSAQPKVGTGLSPTPLRCGISRVCNFKTWTHTF